MRETRFENTFRVIKKTLKKVVGNRLRKFLRCDSILSNVNLGAGCICSKATQNSRKPFLQRMALRGLRFLSMSAVSAPLIQ